MSQYNFLLLISFNTAFRSQQRSSSMHDRIDSPLKVLFQFPTYRHS